MARFPKRSGAELLLEQLCASRTVMSPTSVSMPHFKSITPWEEALAHRLEMPGKSDSFKRQAVSRSVNKKQHLTIDELLTHIRTEAATLDRKRRAYLVVTPYLPKAELFPQKWVRNQTITTFAAPGTSRRVIRIIRERNLAKSDRELQAFRQYEERYPPATYSVTRVNAIDPVDAGEIALEECATCLGMMAYLEVRQYGGSMIRHFYAPLSIFFPSSFTSVHFPTGEIVPKANWYHEYKKFQFNYYPSLLSSDLENKFSRLREDAKQAFRRSNWLDLSAAAYAQLYRSAVAESNEEAFLEFWKLLEMTAKSRDEGDEVIAHRISAFWEEKRPVRYVFEALRSFRNTIIHRPGEKGQVSDDALSTLTTMSIPFLNRFFYVTKKSAVSLEDFRRHCDLRNADKHMLRREMRLISQVL